LVIRAHHCRANCDEDRRRPAARMRLDRLPILPDVSRRGSLLGRGLPKPCTLRDSRQVEVEGLAQRGRVAITGTLSTSYWRKEDFKDSPRRTRRHSRERERDPSIALHERRLQLPATLRLDRLSDLRAGQVRVDHGATRECWTTLGRRDCRSQAVGPQDSEQEKGGQGVL